MKTDDKYKKFFEEYRENIADIAERSCKILQDIYKETCVDKFEEHTEKCNELLSKFKNLCNRF